MIYLIGGEFIEDFAFLVMVTPLFLPLVNKLGYDPIWFGIVLMVTIMIGMIIPPVAVCPFIASSITKVPLGTIYKGIYPYLAGMVVCLIILLFFPQITLWLPQLLIK